MLPIINWRKIVFLREALYIVRWRLGEQSKETEAEPQAWSAPYQWKYTGPWDVHNDIPSASINTEFSNQQDCLIHAVRLPALSNEMGSRFAEELA